MKLIDLIITQGKDDRYVKFITALCSCLGEAIASNQECITEALLKVL